MQLNYIETKQLVQELSLLPDTCTIAHSLLVDLKRIQECNHGFGIYTDFGAFDNGWCKHKEGVYMAAATNEGYDYLVTLYIENNIVTDVDYERKPSTDDIWETCKQFCEEYQDAFIHKTAEFLQRENFSLPENWDWQFPSF